MNTTAAAPFEVAVVGAGLGSAPHFAALADHVEYLRKPKHLSSCAAVL